MVLTTFSSEEIAITAAIDGARGEKKGKKGDFKKFCTKKLYYFEQKTDREKKESIFFFQG